MKKHVKAEKIGEDNLVMRAFDKYTPVKHKKLGIAAVLATAIFFRILCGFGGYSGKLSFFLHADMEILNWESLL